MGLSPTVLWQRLLRREGLSGYQEIIDDFRHRFGDEAAEAFHEAMTEHARKDQHRMVAVAGVDYAAEPALRSIPAPLFLDILEDAADEVGFASSWQIVQEANRLFERRGINYRLNGDRAEWHGDPSVYQEVVAPALEALVDPRLGGARNEYEAALGHLRSGTDKDMEDAVEEAGKSVESAMKVLLDEKGVARTGKEAAFALFDLMSNNGVVIPEAKEAVVATARIRNNYGGHGAGAMPRKVPEPVAELAVRTAASSITFLASHLP